MPSTKIINVQKGDSFEEVFETFKNTDAQEVIFIFPKSTKFSKNENYLSQIKEESVKSGKLVSIMSSDPVIVHLATTFDIELLARPQPRLQSKPKLPIVPNHQVVKIRPTEENEEYGEVNQENVNDTFDVGDETEEEEDDKTTPSVSELSADEAPEATLAFSRLSAPLNIGGTRKIIRDIIKDEPERNLEIEESENNSFDVNIKKGNIFSERESDIEKVWSNIGRSQQSRSADNPERLYSAKQKKRFPKWILAISLIIIIGGIAFVAYSSLSKATISIYPEKQTLNFQLKLSASSVISSVDFESNLIPGQLFSAKAEESGIYTVTGQKDVVQKASGKITVYNRGSTPQRLVATTRFESVDGLIFRIPETIILPPAATSGGQNVFGSIDTLVYADRPGSEYNIEAGRFTIPGLKGTPKFDSFFALSTAAMSGGIVGPASVVTEEDYSKAQQELSKRVKDKLIQSLQDQAKELKTIDSPNVKIEIPVSNAKVGEATTGLKMTVSGTAQTMAFRESDVKKLINDYISTNNNAEITDNNIDLNYQTPILNSDSTAMSFTAQVGGTAYKKVDKSKILKDVLGMDENTVRSYFGNMPGISAKIMLSPFWTKKVPTNSSKVNIVIINK